MISSHFDTMVSALLPSDGFQPFRAEDLPRLPRTALDDIIGRAQTALREQDEHVPLSKLLADPDAAIRAFDKRRARLAALAMGEAVTNNGRFVAAAADCANEICMEGSWTEPVKRDILNRCAPPDARAAATAELLSWTMLLLSSAFQKYAPCLSRRIFTECEERVLCYLDDPSCREALLRRANAPEAARALAVSCVILSHDESTRWLRLKNALWVADRCMALGWLERTYAKSGLKGWLKAANDLSDMALLVDMACGGNSGLRTDEDLRRAMRLPCRLHIAGRWFVDECTAMRPQIAGEDLYRVGAIFDDDTVCALGCALAKAAEAEASKARDAAKEKAAQGAKEADTQRPAEGAETQEDARSSAGGYGQEGALPANGITARMLNALWRDSMERENSRLREAEYEQSDELALLAARPRGETGFYAALRAGSLTLFLDGEPVLIDGPGGAALRSVPQPAGFQPVRQVVSDAQLRTDGFPTLTMNLFPAYPKEACVSSWQRTLMLTGGGSTARLLDAFDFSGQRASCALRFVTPHRPVIAVGAARARIGHAYVDWESVLEPSVELLDTPESARLWCGQLYALVLTQPAQVAGGCWTVTFTRAKA